MQKINPNKITPVNAKQSKTNTKKKHSLGNEIAQISAKAIRVFIPIIT